jgi:hypothetical protein
MKGMIAGTLFQQPCTAAVVCLVHCAVACGVHAQHLSFAAWVRAEVKVGDKQQPSWHLCVTWGSCISQSGVSVGCCCHTRSQYSVEAGVVHDMGDGLVGNVLVM